MTVLIDISVSNKTFQQEVFYEIRKNHRRNRQNQNKNR